MEVSRIIRILDRSFCINITEVLDFWEFNKHGELEYIDDECKYVDEDICPKITHDVYSGIIKGVIKGILEFMAQDPDWKFNPMDIEFSHYVIDSIQDASIEGYSELEDFNITIEEHEEAQLKR
jgi:hypothetical protein